jgi:hypothetical protein
MNIKEELSFAADMQEDQNDGEANLYRKAQFKIEQLEEALKDANAMCRSSYQVARRNGKRTSWPIFRRNLEASLERQHKVMHPRAKATLTP